MVTEIKSKLLRQCSKITLFVSVQRLSGGQESAPNTLLLEAAPYNCVEPRDFSRALHLCKVLGTDILETFCFKRTAAIMFSLLCLKESRTIQM